MSVKSAIACRSESAGHHYHLSLFPLHPLSVHQKFPNKMGKYTSSESLLPHTRQVTARTSKTSIALLISLFALLTILTPNPLTSLFTSSTRPHPFSNEGRTVKSSCDQAQPLIPEKSVHDISTVLSHKDEIIKWHQGLIRIKSMSFDQMGEPGEDHRWDVFGDLHACTSPIGVVDEGKAEAG